jgi:hypothetical protein
VLFRTRGDQLLASTTSGSWHAPPVMIRHPRITVTQIAAMRTCGHQLMRSNPVAA